MDERFNEKPGELDPEEELEEINEGDIIEMIDDETGETVPFIYLKTMEYNNEMYIALAVPEEDLEDSGEYEISEVRFLKCEKDDEGNDVFSTPDDEMEDTLYEMFVEEYAGDESDEDENE